MYWVYVLASKKDGKLYVGSTSNLNIRLKEHNRGKVKSTKGRRPLELIYNESLVTVTQVRKRENYFKSGYGRRWLKDKLITWRGGRAA